MIYLRVKKVLEKPSTEDGDSSLREASLGSPSIGLHHAKVVEGTLLRKMMVNEL